MPEITTISVSPTNAAALREVRDEGELPNMDAALGHLLEREEITSEG